MAFLPLSSVIPAQFMFLPCTICLQNPAQLFFSHNLSAINYTTQPRKILIVNCSLILVKLPHLRHLEVCPKLDSFRFCNNSIAKNTEMKMFRHFCNIYNILLSIVIFFYNFTHSRLLTTIFARSLITPRVLWLAVFL